MQKFKTLEQDGFRIAIQWDYDPCPDLSHWGEWSETPLPDERLSVDHRARGGSRNQYRYWNPDYATTATDLKGVMREFQGKGEDKNTAYRRVMDWRMRSYRIMRDNELMVVYVNVTASRHGVELGFDSLCGIEILPDNNFDEEIQRAVDEHEMIQDAILEARKTLTKLCATTGSEES